MLMSASSPIIGPESEVVGGSVGGPFSGASNPGLGGLSSPQPQVNVKESTLVISNSSTCTLKLQSSSAKPFKKGTANHTYTVQFNKETTKTKTSSEVKYYHFHSVVFLWSKMHDS